MKKLKTIKKDNIPERTILRMPYYLKCLLDLKQSGLKTVSSDAIALKAHIKASQFRKDLSYFGEFGTQGLGYSVDYLLNEIAKIMHLDREHEVVLIGAGNLGSALVNYLSFSHWHFSFTHIFDKDLKKVGKKIAGITIESIAALPAPLGVDLGIVAVPAAAAQEVCGLLEASGIKGILNFSGTRLSAQTQTAVRNVDLNHELAVLSYFTSLNQQEILL